MTRYVPIVVAVPVDELELLRAHVAPAVEMLEADPAFAGYWPSSSMTPEMLALGELLAKLVR